MDSIGWVRCMTGLYADDEQPHHPPPNGFVGGPKRIGRRHVNDQIRSTGGIGDAVVVVLGHGL
jgi:hypothetical protein